MTDTIQDPSVQDAEEPEASPTALGPRSKLPVVIAIAGAAALLAVAAIAFWPTSSTKAPEPTPGFASGTTVEVVLSCDGPDTPCAGGVTAPDGTQWFWATPVDETVPTSWQSREITGSLVTDGEWGTVTYTSGDQSVTLFGGLATPEHSYFG
jgi:hypothetical protein